MKRTNHVSTQRSQAKQSTEFGAEFLDVSKRHSTAKRQSRPRVGGGVSEKLNEVSEALLISQMSNRQ